MIASFGLSWIPYVGAIGGILGIIGVILVLLGRRAFGPVYQRYAVLGGTLIIVTVIGGIIVAVGLVASIVGQVTSAGTNNTAIANSLENDLAGVFIAAAILAIIGGLGQVLLVYALADRTTQLLLWGAFVLSVVLSIFIAAYFLPQIDSAITQAFSTNPPNPTPVNTLETNSNLLGLTRAIPSLMFLWAYLRARTEGISRAALGTSGSSS